MRKLFISALLVSAIVACGGGDTNERTDGYSNAPENKEDSLFEDVMEGHDVAMAKMGKIRGLRKQVERKLDSITRLPAKEKLDSAFRKLSVELREAEEGMNRWMDEFEIDSAVDNVGKRLDYLHSEKIKVDKVRDDILSIIEKADSLLEKKTGK